MTPSPLIANLILPALVGLVVGFSGGLTIGAAVTLRWICRKTPEGDGVPIYHDDTNPTPGRRPWRGGEHFSKLGWVFVILGLLGILLGSWSLWRNQQTAACVAQFTQFNADTQQQRAVAADLDRQADHETTGRHPRTAARHHRAPHHRLRTGTATPTSRPRRARREAPGRGPHPRRGRPAVPAGAAAARREPSTASARLLTRCPRPAPARCHRARCTVCSCRQRPCQWWHLWCRLQRRVRTWRTRHLP
jgi:hypothetical protein